LIIGKYGYIYVLRSGWLSFMKMFKLRVKPVNDEKKTT